jgi:hypothetical protein
MTALYKVQANKPLSPSDPLHVSKFFSPLRLHRKKMQDRQDLILYLAQLHASATQHRIQTGCPKDFCEIPLRLMSLRDWVHDYRVALDYFFEVKNTGFNLGNSGHEISTLVPKDLGRSTLDVKEKAQLRYVVPETPDDGVISKVYVQQHKAEAILRRLTAEKRIDLVAPVEWLLTQCEVNFWFKPAGRLQQRDTSIWPVAAVETWPSWLRESLFGGGIDIESAYTQYLMQHLTAQHAHQPEKLKQLYPDLIRSITDKAVWRHELCEVLGLQHTDESLSTVKHICMSLANGSSISPAILSRGTGFSVTSEIIVNSAADISEENLERIGLRLQAVARQYKAARRAVCLHYLKLNPTRQNQKQVFSSYFEWERHARYQIWEAVDRHGIMVHDGIDGIPESYTRDLPAIIAKIGLRVTV